MSRPSLLIALLPLVLAAACHKQAPEARQEAPAASPAPAPEGLAGVVDRSHRGEAASAKPFLGPDGAPATLGSFHGRPVLVNLWATWCGPCVAEMPTLDRLAATGTIPVVAVSQDGGNAGGKLVADYFAKAGFKALRPYRDATMGLMVALKADSLPTTILYDGRGRELWRVMGGLDWTGDKAKGLLAEGK